MINITLDEVLLAKDVLLPYGDLVKSILVDNMKKFFIQDEIMFNMLILLIVFVVIGMFLPKEKQDQNNKKEKDDGLNNSSPFMKEEGESFGVGFLNRLLDLLRSYTLTGIIFYTVYKLFNSLVEIESQTNNPYTKKLLTHLNEKINISNMDYIMNNELVLVLGVLILTTDLLYLFAPKFKFKFGFFIRGLARLSIYAGLVLAFIGLSSLQEQYIAEWDKDMVQPYLNSLDKTTQETEITRYEVNPNDPEQIYVEFKGVDINGKEFNFADVIKKEQIHITPNESSYIEYKVVTKDINAQITRGFLGLDIYISEQNTVNLENTNETE